MNSRSSLVLNDEPDVARTTRNICFKSLYLFIYLLPWAASPLPDQQISQSDVPPVPTAIPKVTAALSTPRSEVCPLS